MLRFMLSLAVLLCPFVGGAVGALRVVDDEGQPVRQFEFMIHTANDGYSHWTKGVDGMVPGLEFQSYGRASLIDVLVRANGFASATRSFQGDDLAKLRNGDAPAIRLSKGEEYRLRLKTPEGVELPKDLLPQVYFPEYAWRVRAMRQPENLRDGAKPDFNMLNVRTAENGEFVLRLPNEKRAFSVAIHHPGWLRMFEAGPYTVADFRDGVLRIDVPRAVRLTAQLDLGDADRSGLLFDRVRYQVVWNLPGQKDAYLSAATGEQPVADSAFSVEDVAPGNYMITLYTASSQASAKRAAADVDPTNFRAQKKIEVKPNGVGAAKFAFVPFDADAFRGNRNAEIKILNFDGTPAAGKKAKVGYFDGHYGLLKVFEGEVPADGVVRLENVTDRVSELTDTPYDIEVGDQRLGMFRIAASDELQKREYRMAPQAGDRAPDIALVDARTGETLRLADYRGRVVFLEFWATWCGPCQPAMEKLNKEVSELRDAWKELAVVPVSVDDTRDLVVPHVDTRGWTNMRHFWSGGGKERSFFSSPAAEAFGINGVPSAILIDRDGRIAWCGHPSSIDLAERMKEFAAPDKNE